MKKLFAVLLAALLCMSFAACSNQEENEVEENNTPTVETPAEEEQEKEETPPAEEVEDIEEEAAEEVDYSTPITDWMYQLESDDEAALALMAIDACEYGTAGASLKQNNAAVQLLKLTAMESVEDALNNYLEGMNATQKDYFSFQWQMSKKAAEELLTMEDASALLEESGNSDVDLTAYSAEAISALDEMVMTALQEAGVNDEWKNHLELEPFMNWQDDETTTA